MRITSETMVTRSLDRLQSRLSDLERSQSQLSTGKRILKPSDDPASARRAMSLQSSVRAREQDLRNASDARGWLDTADSQLQSALNRLTRVRELATRGASESDPGERAALASEVEQISEEIMGIANARHLEQPLFGGFDREGPVTKNADGTWTIRDNGPEAIERRLSDSEKVRVNITAAEWLTFGDGDENNTLALLDQISKDLRTGSPREVSARLETLSAAHGKVTEGLATIGSATNRVDSARMRAEDLGLRLRTELSDVEDIDVAKGVMELQLQETGFEATLQALGRALPPSLAAFLR